MQYIFSSCVKNKYVINPSCIKSIKSLLHYFCCLLFSFHEMGVYDMTTTIDFILKTTGYSKLDVVGYSLGTTISLACLSDKPEYNSKINKLVLMAPTSRLKSSGMPLNIIKQYSSFLKVSICTLLVHLYHVLVSVGSRIIIFIFIFYLC